MLLRCHATVVQADDQDFKGQAFAMVVWAVFCSAALGTNTMRCTLDTANPGSYQHTFFTNLYTSFNFHAHLISTTHLLQSPFGLRNVIRGLIVAQGLLVRSCLAFLIQEMRKQLHSPIHDCQAVRTVAQKLHVMLLKRLAHWDILESSFAESRKYCPFWNDHLKQALVNTQQLIATTNLQQQT